MGPGNQLKKKASKMLCTPMPSISLIEPDGDENLVSSSNRPNANLRRSNSVNSTKSLTPSHNSIKGFSVRIEPSRQNLTSNNKISKPTVELKKKKSFFQSLTSKFKRTNTVSFSPASTTFSSPVSTTSSFGSHASIVRDITDQRNSSTIAIERTKPLSTKQKDSSEYVDELSPRALRNAITRGEFGAYNDIFTIQPNNSTSKLIINKTKKSSTKRKVPPNLYLNASPFPRVSKSATNLLEDNLRVDFISPSSSTFSIGTPKSARRSSALNSPLCTKPQDNGTPDIKRHKSEPRLNFAAMYSKEDSNYYETPPSKRSIELELSTGNKTAISKSSEATKTTTINYIRPKVITNFSPLSAFANIEIGDGTMIQNSQSAETDLISKVEFEFESLETPKDTYRNYFNYSEKSLQTPPNLLILTENEVNLRENVKRKNPANLSIIIDDCESDNEGEGSKNSFIQNPMRNSLSRPNSTIMTCTPSSTVNSLMSRGQSTIYSSTTNVTTPASSSNYKSPKLNADGPLLNNIVKRDMKSSLSERVDLELPKPVFPSSTRSSPKYSPGSTKSHGSNSSLSIDVSLANDKAVKQPTIRTAKSMIFIHDSKKRLSSMRSIPNLNQDALDTSKVTRRYFDRPIIESYYRKSVYPKSIIDDAPEQQSEKSLSSGHKFMKAFHNHLRRHQSRAPQIHIPLVGGDLTTRAIFEHKTVPWVVTKCLEEIERRGIYEEGIYRKSGAKLDIQKILVRFDHEVISLEKRYRGRDKVDKIKQLEHMLQGCDIHSITGAIKEYMRKLPDPLISTDHYKEFIAIGSK